MGDEQSDYDDLFKLVLIGDTAVGKTSLLLRFAEDSYAENHMTTIGVDFRHRLVKLDDGTKVKIEVWDTAGQERFRAIAQAYYRDADGVIMIYDVTNAESFDHVDEWLVDVKNSSTKNPVIVLVGNKADLEQQRQVSLDQAKAYAKNQGLEAYESSAKTALNVETIFLTVAKELVRRQPKKEKPAPKAALPPPKKKESCCS